MMTTMRLNVDQWHNGIDSFEVTSREMERERWIERGNDMQRDKMEVLAKEFGFKPFSNLEAISLKNSELSSDSTMN